VSFFPDELGLDGALRHTNSILPMVALARSIADLAGVEVIGAVRAAEALQYRARRQV
jgi:predicted ATPase with chaperone activity